LWKRQGGRGRRRGRGCGDGLVSSIVGTGKGRLASVHYCIQESLYQGTRRRKQQENPEDKARCGIDEKRHGSGGPAFLGSGVMMLLVTVLLLLMMVLLGRHNHGVGILA
jgi:hypothetical protein